MKSPEQIAQYIADEFILESRKRIALIVAIRHALTAYADERVQEAQTEMYWQPRYMVRNEALEEAAKIGEWWPGDGGIVPVDDVHDPQACMNSLRKGIANAIRALKTP